MAIFQNLKVSGSLQALNNIKIMGKTTGENFSDPITTLTGSSLTGELISVTWTQGTTSSTNIFSVINETNSVTGGYIIVVFNVTKKWAFSTAVHCKGVALMETHQSHLVIGNAGQSSTYKDYLTINGYGSNKGTIAGAYVSGATYMVKVYPI